MAQIKLDSISTKAPKDFHKEKIKQKTADLLVELNDLQNLLYAESKYAVLVIIQGMDASGKDGAIRNVFGHLNPEGVQVQSFKIPTAEELAHDFLWRIHKHAPAKGMIQIFNRSQYEDVLVTRVHKLIDDKTAYKRMKAINNFEELLAVHNNTQILKFFLHVSPDEQQERLQERINNPQKQWKYNETDFREAALWKEYMQAYEDCFSQCDKIPWIIVPSDQNWYKEFLITETLHKTLTDLKMRYPGIKK
ncbi:MAG: PPK2 family polyphosphate kinase [Chitinophagaceae bacterium]